MKTLKISIIFLLACCFCSCSSKIYTGTVRKIDRVKSVFTSDEFVLVLECEQDTSVKVFRINERLYYSIQPGERISVFQEPIGGGIQKIEILK